MSSGNMKFFSGVQGLGPFFGKGTMRAATRPGMSLWARTTPHSTNGVLDLPRLAVAAAVLTPTRFSAGLAVPGPPSMTRLALRIRLFGGRLTCDIRRGGLSIVVPVDRLREIAAGWRGTMALLQCNGLDRSCGWSSERQARERKNAVNKPFGALTPWKQSANSAKNFGRASFRADAISLSRHWSETFRVSS